MISRGPTVGSAVLPIERVDGDIEEKLTDAREIGMCTGSAQDFAARARMEMPMLSTEECCTNFREVETGFTEDGGLYEGQRCFQCGVRLQIPAAPQPPEK